MASELKPSGEKSAKKPKKAEAKKAAEPKAKPKFALKKHKRAVKGGGHTFVSAICFTADGKQLAQLSSTVTDEHETIVKGLISDLNEGTQSVEDVVEKLNHIKGRSDLE